MSKGVPGQAGIVWIVVAVLSVSTMMTIMTNSFGHWPLVVLGIIVGLWAVESINK